MRIVIAAASFVLALLPSLAAAPLAGADRITQASPRRELQVLFIGNSYLYYNNTPRLLEAIAAATAGPLVHTELVAHGGWTLADHWDDQATRAAMERRRWDWIVVNEQSMFGDTYLVDGEPRVHSSSAFEASVMRFADVARTRGARLAVVAHWPRRDAPARDRDALRYAFDSVARTSRVVLIPAADAWAEAARVSPTLSLYDADGSHPSPAGSYLLAGLLYASLTKQSPAGAPSAITGAYIEHDEGVVQADRQVALVELSTGDAALLQRAALSAARGRARHGSEAAPAPIDLPRLPATGDAIALGDLVGTWRGSTTVYPVSPAAALELMLHAENGALRGILVRRLGPSPEATESSEVLVAATGHVLTFTDPKGPNGGTVVYKGVRQGQRLKGVVEFVIPVPMLHGIGRWTLEKTP